MYCESCGKKIDESLNYCNGCGAQLFREPRSQRSLAGIMIAAVSITTITGLIIIGALLVTLLERVTRPEGAFVFAMVCVLALFGISFMMIRQVSRLIDHELKVRELPKRSAEPLVQLPQRSTNQLDEYREPASVTEQTTRTLDQVPR